MSRPLYSNGTVCVEEAGGDASSPHTHERVQERFGVMPRHPARYQSIRHDRPGLEDEAHAIGARIS